MDVLLDEDEEILRDALRRYFEAESDVRRVRIAEDQQCNVDSALWTSLAELGWLGLAFPAVYGGSDAPITQLTLLFEEAGRALAPVPLHPHVVAGMALASSGNHELCDRWLPVAAEGTARLGFAWSEGRGVVGDDAVRLAAVRDGNGWRLSGEKRFVDSFEGCDAVVVAVRKSQPEGDAGISLVLVEVGTEGFSAASALTLAGDRQSTLVFDDVFVTEADFLAEPGDEVRATLELAVVLNSAMIIGASRRAVERAVDYAKERVAFGKPIGAFQAIQHMCANMITWVDGAELLNREAAWLMSQGHDASLAVSSAKAFVNERCQAALREANQIHGGLAQVREYDQQLWYRRAAAWSMRLGTSIEHRRRVAELLALGASETQPV